MSTSRELGMLSPAKNVRNRKISLSDWMLPLLIVLTAIGAGIVQPRFLSVSNGINLACQLAPLLIISLG